MATDEVVIYRPGEDDSLGGTYSLQIQAIQGNSSVSTPYDLSFNIGYLTANTGINANSGVIATWNCPRPVEIQTVFYQTIVGYFTLTQPCEACSTIVAITINGDTIGNIFFGGGNYVGEATYIAETPITMQPGDQLSIVAPTDWHNGSGLAITLPLTLLPNDPS